MDNANLFRKAAVERLQSPDQLDQLVDVASPKAWIALIALCALLGLGIVWSVVGVLPTKVNAQGLLIKTGGVFNIFSLGSGPVSAVLVKEGDEVQADQIVAKIEQPELTRQVANLRAELLELRAQHVQITSYTSRDSTVRGDSQTLRRQQLASQIQFSEQQIQAMRDQVANQEALLERGLVTRQTILQTRSQLFSAQDQLERSKSDLQQLSVGELSMRGDHDREIARSQLMVNDTARRLQLAEAQLELVANVKSPSAGRILEVKVRPGDVIGQGGAMASLQMNEQTAGLEALIYVPSSDGKNIQPGMAVQISPSSAPRQEFGFIKGSVTFVSQFPATMETMTRVLGNARMAEGLSSAGPPFAVYVQLEKGAGASRFAWSSPKGESLEVNSGTPCTATITVRNRHPIALVIPLIREYAGL